MPDPNDCAPEFAAFIEFTCPICKAPEKNTIPVPAPAVDEETDTAVVQEYRHVYFCGNCLHSHSMLVRNLNQRISVQLVEAPDSEVKAGKAFWTGEFEDAGDAQWRLPEDAAYDSFDATLADVREVLESPHAEFFQDTLSRMAFIQIFAALEAYLSDTLLSRAVRDSSVLTRLLAGVTELKGIKVSLADIHADPDIVRKTVARTITAISFHNLMKVDGIYNVGFGFSIFEDPTIMPSMLAMVPLRHDCVHRNGRSEDGTVREVVNFGLVRRALQLFEIMVRHIESELNGVDYLTDDERTRPPTWSFRRGSGDDD
ncbi:hypothetical protein LH128_00472 [Sphingomonas sp. LH128]|uniref:hypothetical protein n=1 Tax=Sphingomonas sp. LH128 TaxID=473781 RepID=UPI00027CB824|nr:hypothetical protein [Sphingomonas sp. LH128]EJU15110.1 hypothetical protein LH128_00472 [Sphingomonas sp. LH128]